jgi:hypothetical protein
MRDLDPAVNDQVGQQVQVRCAIRATEDGDQRSPVVL